MLLMPPMVPMPLANSGSILEVKLMMDFRDFIAKMREFYLPCLVNSQYDVKPAKFCGFMGFMLPYREHKKNFQYALEVLAKDYAYISKPSSAITLRFNFYYKEDDHWIEISSDILEISKSEVPTQILEMLEKSPKNEEVDIGDFIEEELKSIETEAFKIEPNGLFANILSPGVDTIDTLGLRPTVKIISNWNSAIEYINRTKKNFLKNLQKYSCNVCAVYANEDFISLIFETYRIKNNELKNRDSFIIPKSEVPVQILEMLEKSPKNEKVDIRDFIEEELNKLRNSMKLKRRNNK